MSCGAFARTSPSSPGEAMPPSSFTIRMSTPGVGRPSVFARTSSESSTLAIVRIGDSVSP